MKVEDTPANAESCLCPGCPTHDDCMKEREERLFCSRGKTGCEPSPNGCLCGECPVWASHRLGDYYFCRAGAGI